MSELKTFHLDDFTLLRYVTDDLPGRDRADVARHLGSCETCSAVERDIRELDAELRELASAGEAPQACENPRLPPGDPFRTRPPRVERRFPRGAAAELAALALEASERALPLCEQILEATGESGRLSERLTDLSLSDACHRFGLLYALQESGRRIAESPTRSLRFGEEALKRLRREPFSRDLGDSDTERIVPRLLLRGQAHLLAGQACTWTREFERARSHLELAYRSFAREGSDEMSLAIVENSESQRRSFVGRGAEALVLARRAERTFEEYGLEDLVARARVARGLAFFDLGRQEEAVEAYRQALPVFESLGLWSNYVGVLNSIGTSLARAGRLDEAKREYARALRRLSREQHRSWLAFIRHGLADILFASGRYREAAVSLAQASRAYADSGMVARSLTASLWEIESWARHGAIERARHRLDLFFREVARHGGLEESVMREIDEALSGGDPDFERVATLRHQTEAILYERLGLAPA